MNKTVFAVLGLLMVVVLMLMTVPSTRDAIDWGWASFKDDTASYEWYMQHHEGDKHVNKAKDIIDSRGWQMADLDNTIRSYQTYVIAIPYGKEIKKAKARISALRSDNSLYEAALDIETKRALERFLTDYPSHDKESEAQEALGDIDEDRNIADLVKEGKIEVQARGSGINGVRVRIRKLTPYNLTVHIPTGSYFVSAKKSVQNMIVTGEFRLRLTNDGWQKFWLPAACANMSREIPGDGDTFTVERSPHQDELNRLLQILDEKNKAYGRIYGEQQAAIWIVTDDASLVELRRPSIRGNSGMINHYDSIIRPSNIIAAMYFCSKAGIDIKQKAIWSSRREILDDVKYNTNANLYKPWLRKQIAEFEGQASILEFFGMRWKLSTYDETYKDREFFFRAGGQLEWAGQVEPKDDKWQSSGAEVTLFLGNKSKYTGVLFDDVIQGKAKNDRTSWDWSARRVGQ